MKHSVPRKIVLIGASTGGPKEIEKIVLALPILQDSSVVIGQHMAVGFMSSFAKRLGEHNTHKVVLVEEGTPLETGTIYVCEGRTSVVKNASGNLFSKQPLEQHSFNPDINFLFDSFVSLTKECKILCSILTGIGEDGVSATKTLSENGASCITQTSQSAIVDGMPSRARKEIENIRVNTTSEIVDIIKEFCS